MFEFDLFLILETYFRTLSICQKLLEHGTFNRFLIFFSKRDTERDIDTVYLVANTPNFDPNRWVFKKTLRNHPK